LWATGARGWRFSPAVAMADGGRRRSSHREEGGGGFIVGEAWRGGSPDSRRLQGVTAWAKGSGIVERHHRPMEASACGRRRVRARRVSPAYGQVRVMPLRHTMPTTTASDWLYLGCLGMRARVRRLARLGATSRVARVPAPKISKYHCLTRFFSKFLN
jgi:hypothetical protein